MTPTPHVTVYDGKYTLILDPTAMRALRYGEPWPARDLTGDGFVMALGQEIIDLTDVLREAAQQFRRYEVLHRAKQSADGERKAVVNGVMATKCEAAVARVLGQ